MTVFGVPEQGTVMSNNCQDACTFACLLALRRILLDGKSSKPPSVSLWLSDVVMFLKLEKMKYSLRGSNKRFIQYGLQCFYILGVTLPPK